MGKLSNLRNGKPINKLVSLGNIEVAVVVLPSDVIREIEEKTAQHMKDIDSSIAAIKNLCFDQLLCYHCMRDPEDPTLLIKVADNVQETKDILDVEDINRITQAYSELMMNKYEGLELMTNEKLEDIKKYLEQIKLSDLNTVSQVHLENFHQAMPSKI